MNRVVITGLGVISPLGNDINTFWNNIVQGKSGVGPITQFDASEFAVKIAAEVKDFNPVDFINKKDARRMDRFVQFAVAAAKMALEHAGLDMNKVEQ